MGRQLPLRVLVSALVLSSATTTPAVAHPETVGWDEYVRLFGKLFRDDAHREERRAVYEQSVMTINAHNVGADRGLSTFRMGINRFSDQTPEEFRSAMLSGFAVGARRRPATGACRTALRADCGQAHVAGLAECINCVQAHDANLTAANCSTVQKESFCANAPGPLPPPPPPPPGPPVPPPPPPPPSPTPAPTPPAPPIPPGHIPEAVDWRKHGAVTPVKDQGQCGGCWAFAAVASLEGHYQLATGALRSLSEEQLLDCSGAFGNRGCYGGNQELGFQYIASNGGIDSELDYPFSLGSNGAEACWPAAANRTVATLDGYKIVPNGSEPLLIAAVAAGPVAVAIQANQPGFQHYKSGVFDGECGNALDHAVTVIGYTADAFVVKNSWGDGWGEDGYIRMKRNVGPTGQCGIAEFASYPVKSGGPPVPLPPRTQGKRPSLPCNCTQNCHQMCGKFGGAFMCCGDEVCSSPGNCEKGCNCLTTGSCPQCLPPPPPPYSACGPDCLASMCLSTLGIPGHICVPR